MSQPSRGRSRHLRRATGRAASSCGRTDNSGVARQCGASLPTHQPALGGARNTGCRGQAAAAGSPRQSGRCICRQRLSGRAFQERGSRQGRNPSGCYTHVWASAPDEQRALARTNTHNRAIHHVRGRIEKIFGTWKQSYGLRRMRWCGLAKAAVQVRLTAIAYNLKRTLNLFTQPAWYPSMGNPPCI